MLADDVGIRRAGEFLLDLARQLGHVPGREQVMAIEGRRYLEGCPFSGVVLLGRR